MPVTIESESTVYHELSGIRFRYLTVDEGNWEKIVDANPSRKNLLVRVENGSAWRPFKDIYLAASNLSPAVLGPYVLNKFRSKACSRNFAEDDVYSNDRIEIADYTGEIWFYKPLDGGSIPVYVVEVFK